MKILAIETSCDETSIALVEVNGNPFSKSRSASWRIRVLQNIVSSQIAVHRPFGGVVPNLAKREHLKNLPKIFQNLQLTTNNLQLDAIAVTVGPGLEPALWTGIEFAKELQRKMNGSPSTSLDAARDKSLRANRRKVRLFGVNHMEGHLYSFLLPGQQRKNFRAIEFPAIALIVSGGHTILLKMDSLTKWKKLGETRDDAAGEAFDKVARMMKLPYPGGPEIEKLALRQAQGKQKKGTIDFPRPMLRDKNYDFSFSGLKTSVLYYLRDNPKAKKADVAASFQQAALDVLVGKTMRAAREFGAKSILLSGGVAANQELRQKLSVISHELSVNFFVPDFEYNTDNAAMIAAAAYIRLTAKKKPYRLTAQANLNL